MTPSVTCRNVMMELRRSGYVHIVLNPKRAAKRYCAHRTFFLIVKVITDTSLSLSFVFYILPERYKASVISTRLSCKIRLLIDMSKNKQKEKERVCPKCGHRIRTQGRGANDQKQESKDKKANNDGKADFGKTASYVEIFRFEKL